MNFPPLPPPFQEHLQRTDPGAVDAETTEAVRTFCAQAPEIETAYICAAKRTHQGGQPEQVLRLSVKLVSPRDGSQSREERFKEQLPLLERFARAHPDVMRRFGFGILTDGAVPAFERNG